MKKCTMKAIALIGAAAMVSAGTTIPAAAVCGNNKTVQVVFGGPSCSSLSNSDILNILKRYGICLNNNSDPNCTGNNCTQVPVKLPSCIGGYGTQTPVITPDCTGGNCDLTPVKIPSCIGGTQTPVITPSCPTGNCTVTKPDTGTETDGYTVSEYEQEVVRLINEIRAENGLSELKLNTELSKVARVKAQDMKDNRYFSHTSPTYGSPFEMMKTFGISYRTAGENIAYGQRTPEEVVNAWMNSEGHKANILNSSFKEIGMGYVSDGKYWVQMFIG